ncbi:MAG: NfeD family protein [Chloroflexota bacterium]
MLEINLWWFIAIVIIVIAFTVFVVNRGIRAHQQQVSAGREEMVGKIATAETALNPKGIVLIEGERWTAVSDSGRVKPEEEVIVTKVEGLKLRVTKKEGGK